MNPRKEKALLLVKIVAVILLLETAVHLGVRLLPLGRAAGLLDGALLAAMATPIFYYWILREFDEKSGWRESHRESEERFGALVTHASLGIYIIDGGRFQYVNPEFARIFGYTQDEILALTTLDLVADADKAKVRENIRRRQEGSADVIDYTFTGVRKDGSPVEIEIKGSVLPGDGRRVAIGTLADVTARKAAGDALRASEERYRAVVDNIGVGVSLLGPDMKILSMNRRMRDWFPAIDVAAGPVCYRSYNTPAREGVCSYCPVVKTFEDGRTHEAVTDTPTAAGIVHYRVVSTPITDGAGRVVAAIEMVEDITAQMRREADLREALLREAKLNELRSLSMTTEPLAAKLQRMLECLVSTAWLAIERKGCVMIRDGGFVRMAAAAGLSQAVRTACSRLPLGSCLCGRVAQTGEEIAAGEVDARHDVSYEGMPAHGHLTLPLKAGGEVLGALSLYLRAGTSPDASQHEFARAATGIFSSVVLLARTEEKFLQAQKMEAVGRLAAGVAHDFNNILTAIKGYAHFLRKDMSPGDPKGADAEDISKAADRAADLTGRLLAFSRQQVIAPQVLDVNAVVKGMAQMMRRLVGEDIKVTLRLEPALASTTADKGQLEQVIMNLAVNARDAMPGGGALTISTANADLGAWVALSVADTGTGIDPETVKHIFEPFYSTKPQGKGTGLGLATVHGIVEQAGGRVEVRSELGKGSTFDILLPATSRPADAPAPTRSDAPPTGSERVLLVEDEAIVRAVVGRQLAAAGYRVLSAARAEEALSLLGEHDDVRLLVTDVVLPGMNGAQLAEKARLGLPSLKVLYISGYTDGAVSEEGTLREGVDLLQKPFTAETLARRVREALDRVAA